MDKSLSRTWSARSPQPYLLIIPTKVFREGAMGSREIVSHNACKDSRILVMKQHTNSSVVAFLPQETSWFWRETEFVFSKATHKTLPQGYHLSLIGSMIPFLDCIPQLFCFLVIFARKFTSNRRLHVEEHEIMSVTIFVFPRPNCILCGCWRWNNRGSLRIGLLHRLWYHNKVIMCNSQSRWLVPSKMVSLGSCGMV